MDNNVLLKKQRRVGDWMANVAYYVDPLSTMLFDETDKARASPFKGIQELVTREIALAWMKTKRESAVRDTGESI